MKLIKNRLCKLSVIAVAFIFLTSCENLLEDYLDVNQNPNVSTFNIAQEALPVVIFYSSQINFDHAEYGTYLSQALTTGGRSQSTSYAYKSGWQFLTMNRHPQWRRHFYDIGVNVNYLIEDVERTNSRNFELIARSIRLMSTQLTTDMFGDMPLSEAYQGVSPTYDSQDEIYAWMLEEADQLITLYNDESITNASHNIPITTSMDRIYDGDLQKWEQFTKAIKARILLRKLPNWENSPAICNQIISLVDEVLADWEEPQYQYPGGSAERNCPWGPSQPSVNGWESRKNELDAAIPSKFLLVDMMGLYPRPGLFGPAEDPRLPRLMTPRAAPNGTGANIYRYLENNYGMDATYRASNYPDLYGSHWTTNTSYISLITTEELMFIKAEAQYWSGDKSGAFQTTKDAVQFNFDRLGVTESQANRFFNLDKYLPESDFNIGHLMRQKYVAMYLQPEQWTDMRRYAYSNDFNEIKYDGVAVYPTLRRPYNLYEPYWGTRADVNGEWIQRINYDPETEEKYNRQELERLGAFRNPEWLKVPMIWGRQ